MRQSTPHKAIQPSQKARSEPPKEALVLALGTEMFTGPSELEEKCIWGLLHPFSPSSGFHRTFSKHPSKLSYDVTFSKKTSPRLISLLPNLTNLTLPH